MQNKISHILMGATMALAVGALAFAPAAYAAGDGQQGARQHHKGGQGQGRHFGPRRGNFLFAAMCGEKSGDRQTQMLTHFEETIKPTGDQTALWNSLKSAIATASETFSSNCEAPNANDTATPPERMAKGITMMEARLAFSTAVLPAFEAFYDSLTQEQKDALKQRPGRGGFGKHGGKRGGMGWRSNN